MAAEHRGFSWLLELSQWSAFPNLNQATPSLLTHVSNLPAAPIPSHHHSLHGIWGGTGSEYIIGYHLVP